MYLKRKIERVISGALTQFPAIAVTGPRQSGKTTMLKEVLGKKYEYLTFDDPLNIQRAINDPKLLLTHLNDYVIFDEIQYVPEFLHYLKMEIDNKRSKNGRYILTGSQQFGLIKCWTDSCAGRIAVLNLLPFNFHEINPYQSFSSKLYFETACLKGLYPEVFLTTNADASLWYSSYLQTYSSWIVYI